MDMPAVPAFPQNIVALFKNSVLLNRIFFPRSGKVEAVKVHNLVPRRYKVMQELLLGVLATIDFGDGPKLGVRTEDEVDTGAGPREFARCAITTLEQVVGFRGRLPRRAHVEQIHEEVIGKRLGL